MFNAIKSVVSYLRGDDYQILRRKYKISLTNLAGTLHKAQGHDVVPIPIESQDVTAVMASAPATPGVAPASGVVPPSLPDAFGDSSSPSPDHRPALEAASFLKDVIEPYAEILEQAGAMEGVARIIELLDREGGCPSVVVNGSDGIPGTDYASVKDILEQVTLSSHTFRVARLSIEALKASYGEKFEGHLPTTLVAALGHDLGKLTSFRIKEENANKDHPTIGDAAIGQIFKDKYDAIDAAGDDITLSGNLRGKIAWLEVARKIIRDHHTENATGLVEILRTADGRAREMEVAQKTGQQKAVPWSEWFDARTYLNDYIRMEINASQEQQWKAFSLGNIVYCRPELLYDAAKKYAWDLKIISILLVRLTDRAKAIKTVVDSLRSINAVSPELEKMNSHNTYKLGVEHGTSFKRDLIPLLAEVFGPVGELDKTKEGLSGQILSATLEKARGG